MFVNCVPSMEKFHWQYDSVQLQLVFKVAAITSCMLAFYSRFLNFDLIGLHYILNFVDTFKTPIGC